MVDFQQQFIETASESPEKAAQLLIGLVDEFRAKNPEKTNLIETFQIAMLANLPDLAQEMHIGLNRTHVVACEDNPPCVDNAIILAMKTSVMARLQNAAEATRPTLQ